MPEVIINGAGGRIEARYHHVAGSDAPTALLVHPHPQHGGNMSNKVVYTLFQTFVQRKFSTMRFNFRGVGRSQGVYDGGEGELCDAAAALDRLQAYNPNSNVCWVVGLSFGAWIAMQLLMRRPEISGFISLAPPASTHDFSFLAPCPSSGLFICGAEDEVVSDEDVTKLLDKLTNQRSIEIDHRIIDGADHFFTGKHEDLVSHVNDYLDEAMAKGDQAV
ncbi:MAG: alpha/beta hydrolase [Alphaproteobacteria bacterium]|nr:alpha/beta hydrolase [Alphaproteobacteria bacterium]